MATGIPNQTYSYQNLFMVTLTFDNIFELFLFTPLVLKNKAGNM